MRLLGKDDTRQKGSKGDQEKRLVANRKTLVYNFLYFEGWNKGLFEEVFDKCKNFGTGKKCFG